MGEIIVEIGKIISSFLPSVHSVIKESPFVGVFSVLTFLGIILLIIRSASNATVSILRATKGGKYYEEYSKNVVRFMEEATRIYMIGRELSEKHTRIHCYLIVKDQMKQVENMLEELRRDLKLECIRSVQQEFSSIRDEDASESLKCITYERGIKYALDEVLSMFRRIAKDNHLSEKSESEFSSYSKEKVKGIIERTSRSFRIICNLEETDNDNTIMLFLKREDYYEKLELTLVNLRNIAIKYHYMINEEEKKHQDRWDNFSKSVWGNHKLGKEGK